MFIILIVNYCCFVLCQIGKNRRNVFYIDLPSTINNKQSGLLWLHSRKKISSLYLHFPSIKEIEMYRSISSGKILFFLSRKEKKENELREQRRKRCLARLN